MSYPVDVKVITVAELRQNPTAALAEVEAGETYVVTRHQRPIARLVPPGDPDATEALVGLIPARNPGPSHLSDLPPWELTTADSVGQLLEDMKSDW